MQSGANMGVGGKERGSARDRERRQNVMLRLYEVLVRPHLEYREQIWAQYLRKDVLALKRVQTRSTRMIPSRNEWVSI